MAFPFIYLILTQKTYLEHSISEQSSLCNILPESEKNSMANSVSLLNSRAEVLFLLIAQCINKRITFKLGDLSIECSSCSSVLISLDFSIQDSLQLLQNVKSILCALQIIITFNAALTNNFNELYSVALKFHNANYFSATFYVSSSLSKSPTTTS